MIVKKSKEFVQLFEEKIKYSKKKRKQHNETSKGLDLNRASQWYRGL